MIAVGSLLVGIIVSPAVEDWWDVNFRITPVRLSNLLQNADIKGFNDLRKQFHEKVEFDGIDLSNKNLSEAKLNSLIILHSNLSDTDLENSILDNVQISGDLSNINLSSASLFNADLMGSNLLGADLTHADLNLTNLSESILNCDSLKTTSLNGNTSQFHIREYINGTYVEVSGCM